MPVLFDDFERPDGPLGVAPTGQTWLVRQGTFAVVSGKAAATAMTDGHAAAAINPGISDIDMTVELNWTTSTSRTVSFRGVDANNFWHLQYNSFFPVTNGSSPPVNSPLIQTLTSPLITGDVARVRCLGSIIEVYKNATLVGTTTSPTHSSGVEIGFRMFNDLGARWDNLNVERASTSVAPRLRHRQRDDQHRVGAGQNAARSIQASRMRAGNQNTYL